MGAKKITKLLLLLLILGACTKREVDRNEIIIERKHGSFRKLYIQVGNVIRNYRLEVPNNVPLDSPASLIFAFHGMPIDSKDIMPEYTKLNDMAANLKAIIVYPAAQDKIWATDYYKTTVDVILFDNILSKIQATFLIDSANIHIIGISNGANFCHYLGAKRAEVVASVTVHSGKLDNPSNASINAKRKFPILMVHGVNDNVFTIETAIKDQQRYISEKHQAHLIKVEGLGHGWAAKININDSIQNFIVNNPL